MISFRFSTWQPLGKYATLRMQQTALINIYEPAAYQVVFLLVLLQICTAWIALRVLAP